MQILINRHFTYSMLFLPFLSSLYTYNLTLSLEGCKVCGSGALSVFLFLSFFFFFSFLRIVPLYAGFPFIVNHVLIDTTARGLVHGKALIWNDPL